MNIFFERDVSVHFTQTKTSAHRKTCCFSAEKNTRFNGLKKASYFDAVWRDFSVNKDENVYRFAVRGELTGHLS